ncbi:MAG: hypothetical protein PHN69_05185 [Candidatus Pacebacteria bacterium]|nr:hypothetical protein [Candidatus Paceibacterota bacterium]
MTVDIRFFNEDGAEISLDKTTGGHNFGVTRKNAQYVHPVIVKNLGDSDATNVYVGASPLNAPNEIPLEEYNKQVLAASWQTFTMLPSKGFDSTINLPDIPAGQTMKGLKEYNEYFTNPVSSAWVNDTLEGHTFQWTGSSLMCIDGTENDGKIYAKVDAQGWGNNKEIDFICEFNTPVNETSGSAFIMFCLRKNCLGDQKGYLLNLKRRSTTGAGGTAFWEIRKAAGLFDNGKNDFGSILVTSQQFNFTEFTPVRIKLFTNANGLPEIKVWVTNIKDTDTPIEWGSAPGLESWVDNENTYPFAGGISAIFGSGIGGTYEMKYASLITDDEDGKIYIRTTVGDGAVDGETYQSALELYYD